MGKKVRFISLVLTMLVGILGQSAQATEDTSEGVSETPSTGFELDDFAMTVEEAFPEGLPEGAVEVDNVTVSFGEGEALLYLAGIDFSDCTSGQLCLWANSNYQGRTIVLTDCCNWDDLTNYGFSNEMSSWRNHRPDDSLWAYGLGGSGTQRCMDGPSSMSYVGNTDNDKASSAKLKNVSGTC